MVNVVRAKHEFLEIEFSSSIALETLDALLREDLTGIIVRNFLSDSEINLVKERIQNIPSHEKSIINEGFTTYPISFAMYSQLYDMGKMSIGDYVNIAEVAKRNEERYFGISIINKLFDFLRLHPAFEKVSPILEKDSMKTLPTFNLRELYPDSGELIAHCENLFFEEFPSFFEWLKLMDIKDNKLSYFVTIQKPEKGGELCCYDFSWPDVKTRLDHTTLKDNQGALINVDDETLNRTMILPNEGDLLIFSGGNVWHRVMKVLGNKSRITYGGFIAESFEEGKYYVWS